MRPRDILAGNLRTFMSSRQDLNTLPKLTARCGVSNGTLDRIRRAVVSTRIDELQRLADAFGVEPWEMLRPQGGAELSPLGLRLAAHLDRAAEDEVTHAAAYSAATDLIDALTAQRASRPAPQPDHATPLVARRAKEKHGG